MQVMTAMPWGWITWHMGFHSDEDLTHVTTNHCLFKGWQEAQGAELNRPRPQLPFEQPTRLRTRRAACLPHTPRQELREKEGHALFPLPLSVGPRRGKSKRK